MKIRAFTKREKIIVFITAAVITVGAGLSFVPRVFNKIALLERDVETKRSFLKRHMHLINQGADILSLYDTYKHVFENQKAPQEIEADLFNEVRSCAQRLNLTIERITPLPLETAGGHKEIVLEVELGGELESIFKLIQQLESSPLFIKVSSLRLNPHSGPSSLNCRVVLAKVFF